MEQKAPVENPEDSNALQSQQPKPTHNSILNNEEEKGADVEIIHFPQELLQGSGKLTEQQNLKENEFNDINSQNHIVQSQNQIVQSLENIKLSVDLIAEIIPQNEQMIPISDFIVFFQNDPQAFTQKTNKEQRKLFQRLYMYLEQINQSLFNDLKYNFILYFCPQRLYEIDNLVKAIQEVDSDIQWETEIGKYKLIYYKNKDKKKKHSLNLESFPIEISKFLGDKKEDSIVVEKRIIYDLICHFCYSQTQTINILEPHQQELICQDIECNQNCNCHIKICVQEILLQQVQIVQSFSTEIESKSEYNKKRLQHLKLNCSLFQQLVLADLESFLREKNMISGQMTKFGALAQIYANLQLLINEKKVEKLYSNLVLYGCSECLHVMSKLVYEKTLKVFEQLQPQDIHNIEQKDTIKIATTMGRLNCLFENKYIDIDVLQKLWEQYETILFQQFENQQ